MKTYTYLAILISLTFGIFDKLSASPLYADESKTISTSAQLSIFPMPIKEKATITIDLKNSGNIKIEFFDIAGNKINEIKSQYYLAGKIEIPIKVNDFQDGIYLCKVSLGSQVIVRRIVVKNN